MSRELRFRAWDFDNEQMYFSNVETDDVIWTFAGGAMQVETQQIYDTLEDGQHHQRFGYAPPKQSIMQFTRLIDASGLDIYEGDIVRFDVAGDHTRDYKPVLYQKGIVRIDNHGPAFGRWSSEHCSGAKIIGNIHQNPELLPCTP